MQKILNLSHQYVPVQSIIIYMNRGTDYRNREQYYLESHDIQVDKKGNSILLEGKPLRRSSLVDLGKGLATQTTKQLQCKGIIPENLIYFNQEIGDSVIMWFVPEQKHNLFFTKDLNIPSGQGYTPSLLFILRRKTLSVFAIKGNKKPTYQTKLYNAPFHNIHNNGEVCLGNAKKPTDKLIYFDEIMRAWENIFWASEFSRLIGRNPIKSNLNILYKELIQSGKKFPSDELIPHTEFNTIEELFK